MLMQKGKWTNVMEKGNGKGKEDKDMNIVN